TANRSADARRIRRACSCYRPSLRASCRRVFRGAHSPHGCSRAEQGLDQLADRAAVQTGEKEEEGNSDDDIEHLEIGHLFYLEYRVGKILPAMRFRLVGIMRR